jgi:hypothetical protein
MFFTRRVAISFSGMIKLYEISYVICHSTSEKFIFQLCHSEFSKYTEDVTQLFPRGEESSDPTVICLKTSL